MSTIRQEIATDVYQELLAALDEFTTTVMAEAGDARSPYDRGFVDGVITITKAMTEGFNEALASAQPDDALW